MSEPFEITEDLVRRASAGERDAVEQLFAAYLDRIHELVRRRLGNALRTRLETQDVAQTALAEAFRDLDRFEWRGGDSFDRWLHRIIENKIRQKAVFFRRQKRDIFREVDSPGGADSSPHCAAGEPVENLTPSRILGQRHDLERVERALARLPEHYAQVIRWARIEGLPYRAIGERLGGRSEDAVRKLLMRALVKLTKSLDEDDPSDG